MSNNQWTFGERMIVRWQYDNVSGFWSAVLEAMMRADDENLGRLHRAFPSVVDALESWRHGDLAQRLRDAGLMD